MSANKKIENAKFLDDLIGAIPLVVDRQFQTRAFCGPHQV